jgi:hypothetical protein
MCQKVNLVTTSQWNAAYVAYALTRTISASIVIACHSYPITLFVGGTAGVATGPREEKKRHGRRRTGIKNRKIEPIETPSCSDISMLN